MLSGQGLSEAFLLGFVGSHLGPLFSHGPYRRTPVIQSYGIRVSLYDLILTIISVKV